jgi:hypothetical protein
MAIGNGLTDPRIQVGLMHNCFFFFSRFWHELM